MQLIIVSRIYLPEPSAASFFLSSIADEVTARGHNVTVLTAAPPRGTTLPSRAEEIRTFPVLRDRNGYVRGYVQYMSFDIPAFFRVLFAKRPSVVLVEPPPTTGALVRIACRIRRIPYVYDAADLWSVAAAHATNSSLILKMLERLERWALGGASRIITISHSVQTRIEKWGIRKPITVTGRGADNAQFQYAPAPIEKVFLYAGSYSAWHGAIILVDAFANFLARHPGYLLRFIGHGTEQEALLARAQQLGIADSIEFRPPVPPEELSLHLSRATASLATLLPGSGYEFAFATKTYSSVASGCPVIFAGPGPTAEFLKASNDQVRSGWAVAYDHVAISNALSAAVEHPVTEAARIALASWASTHASMRASAAKAADALEDAAKGPAK